MKIGILTITNGTNYGNKLQNYAVVKTFEKMGHNAETIRNITNTFDSRMTSYRIKRQIKEIIGKGNQPIDMRRKRFDAFSKKYLNESKFVIDINNMPNEIGTYYDSFFSGSDQVWNPNYEYNTEIEYMTFASQNKRNSFAASFGVENLTDEQSNKIKPLLQGMNAISVREERAAEIVEELIGKRPFVSIDPTMMLDDRDWNKIKEKPNWKNDKKYIITYFLGGISDEMQKYLNLIASKSNLEIVNLAGEKNGIATEEEFCSNPGEFIWLISNSEIVMTDSFHASVFSILYKKPFRTFLRNDETNKDKKSNSRINTLLNKFGLEKHHGNLEEDIDIIFETDFSNVDNVLKNERMATYSFLEEALKNY